MNLSVEEGVAAPASSRAQALREATTELHAQVDLAVTAINPFRDTDRYSRYLRMQYRFHRLTRDLFLSAELNRWFPGLAARERFSAVALDCQDLGISVADLEHEPALPEPRDDAALASAVGWLYVNEGSNLGAAFLFKAAEGLGLHAGHGARHLAPHEAGRASHWRVFTAQLEQAPIKTGFEPRAAEGARAAFEHVVRLARQALA